MIAIRPAMAEDHDALWEIFHDIVRRGDTYAFAPEMPREEALRLLVGGPAATYVADDEGEVLGLYFLRANQPGLGAHVCNAGYMVRASARGRGVGRLLCRHSIEEARRMGFRAMQYNLVVATNTGAVHLWQDLGFQIIGTLPGAFRHIELGYVDAHVMYRLL
jgi:L-amino acid N-acyltransferase YncA